MKDAAQGHSVLCVGRLYCDLIFTGVPRLPTFGTEVFADGFGVHPGGGAFITAAHLAALGARAGLAAMLPAPPFSDAIAAQLADAGVALDLCRAADRGADAQVTVALVGGGDRAFVTRRSGPAVPVLRPDDLRQRGVQHLHIGELSTLVDHPSLIELARDAGASVSLDCAWDEALTAACIGTLIRQVDVFLPNAAEAQHLTELGVPDAPGTLTVVKRGGDGAEAILSDTTLAEPACAVREVDTTGAGDAFNAGFLTAWLSGAPLAKCLKSGNRQGAKAITQRGGFHGLAAVSERTEAAH